MPEYEGYNIDHNSNGSITLCYTPSDPGIYRICVEKDGRVCPGFPLSCSVQLYGTDYVTSYETACSDPLPPVVYEVNQDQASYQDESTQAIQNLAPSPTENVAVLEQKPLEQPSPLNQSLEQSFEGIVDEGYDNLPPTVEEIHQESVVSSQDLADIQQMTVDPVESVEAQIKRTFVIKEPVNPPVRIIQKKDNVLLVKRDVKLSYVSPSVEDVKEEKVDTGLTSSSAVAASDSYVATETIAAAGVMSSSTVAVNDNYVPGETTPTDSTSTTTVINASQDVETEIPNEPIPETQTTLPAPRCEDDPTETQLEGETPSAQNETEESRTSPTTSTDDQRPTDEEQPDCETPEVCASPKPQSPFPNHSSPLNEPSTPTTNPTTSHVVAAKSPAKVAHAPLVFKNTRSAKKIDDTTDLPVVTKTVRKRRKSDQTLSSPVKAEDSWAQKESFSCEELGCSASFTSTSELESHASEHSITGKSSSTDGAGSPTGAKQISRIVQSLNKYKLGDKERCSIICCGQSFENLELMQKHVEENHKDDVPNDEDSRKRKRETDEEVDDGTPRKVGKRGRKRKPPESEAEAVLDKVLEKVTTKRCHLCEKTFATVGTVRMHIRNIHGAEFGLKKDTEEEKATCEICNKSFFSKYALKEHVERKHERKGQYACEEPDCGKSFNGARDLRRHILLKHSGKEIPKKQHEPEMCQICGQKVSKGNLKAHIKRKHLAVAGSFVCEFEGCGKSFKLADDLKRHALVHTDRPQYMCDVCNKIFKKELSVRIHIDAVHGSDKKIPCPVTGCEKVFPSDYKLKCHVRAVHALKKFEHCRVEGCNKVLGNPQALKMHMMVHEGYRWQCTEGDCTKQFTQKHVLLRHIAAAHRDLDCDFVCTYEDCDKRFKFKSALKVHLKTHTDIRKFECEVCDKNFKTKTLLVAHSKIHDETKQYGCDLCQRKFPRRYRLIEHMSKVHNIQINLDNIDGVITMEQV